MKRVLAALLLWPVLAWGAMDFNGSTGYATASSAEVTGYPMTMCAWVNSDSFTTQRAVMGSSNDINTEYFSLHLRGTSDGAPSTVHCINNGASAPGNAVSTSTYATGTWQHACCVSASATSRSAYLNGGSKGTDTTNSGAVTTPTRTTIGARNYHSTLTFFFDGRVAEPAWWNVALSDAEVASLAKGFAPPCVRRASLVAYYPMVRDTTSLKDRMGSANNLTLTGTTSVATHPPVINCQ